METGDNTKNDLPALYKKTEDALYQSEAFSRGILSSLNSCVAVIDENGMVITVNKAWEDFASENGVTVMERVSKGCNYFDVCKKAAAAGDDIAAQALHGIQSVLKKETKVFELQYPCHSPEKQRWFLMRVMLFENERSMVVVAHGDITEIILSKLKLEETERNLKQVMDNSTEMIWSMDREHQLIIFNKAFSNEYIFFTGAPPVPGIINYKAFGPDGEAYWKQKVDETLAGNPVAFERTYVIGNQTKHIEVFLYPIKKENTIVGATCFVMNITERKKAEQELRKSEAKLREITASLPGVVYQSEMDADGKMLFRFLSDGINKYEDEKVEDIYKDSSILFSKVHPDDIGGLLSAIAQSNKTMEPLIIVYRVFSKEGKYLWVQSDSIPVLQQDGTILRNGSLIDVTATKEAEELLQKSEANLKEAQRIAHIGSWALDLTNNVLSWSEEIYRIFEIDPEKFGASYEAFLDTIHPEDREMVNEAYTQSVKNKTAYDIEHRLLFPDGRIKFVHERCKTFYDEEGTALRSLGTVQDITERKLAEEKIKESEQKYRILMQQAGDSIVLFDSTGQILDVNESALNLLGYNSEEYKKIPLKDFFFEEDLKENPLRFDLLNKGESTINKRKLKRKDGSAVETEIHGKMLSDGRYLGVVRDITERTKAEEQIREQENKYRSLVDTAPDATVIVDEKGVIQIANQQAVKLFGYTNAELTGMSVEMLMPQSQQRRHRGYRRQFIKESHSRPMSMRRDLIAVRKDGFVIPVEISLATFHSAGGILVTVSIRDITQRKKAEKELEESYHSVRQLTEHLQNIREEERTNIAREIHDELGQQLTVMMMDVAFLDKKIGAENSVVKRKIKELMELLDNTVKAVRRISTELRPSVLDHLGLAAAMELHLKEFEKRSGIRTRLALPQKELQLTDQVKNALFRIFQESLTNVARHSGAKNIKVKLEKKINKIVLLIEDDGVGFDKKKVSSKKTLGVLGMKERAASIGGEYLISGEAGKGTTILVNVPLFK